MPYSICKVKEVTLAVQNSLLQVNYGYAMYKEIAHTYLNANGQTPILSIRITCIPCTP